MNEHRTSEAPFDVTVHRSLPPDRAEWPDLLAGLEEAGCTWYRYGWDYEGPLSAEEWHARVLEGPPR